MELDGFKLRRHNISFKVNKRKFGQSRPKSPEKKKPKRKKEQKKKDRTDFTPQKEPTEKEKAKIAFQWLKKHGLERKNLDFQRRTPILIESFMGEKKTPSSA